MTVSIEGFGFYLHSIYSFAYENLHIKNLKTKNPEQYRSTTCSRYLATYQKNNVRLRSNMIKDKAQLSFSCFISFFCSFFLFFSLLSNIVR